MSFFNRREFVRHSAAIAAAMAAGPVVSAAEKEKKEEKKGGPSDRLRVAVIGLRGRGGSHYGAFSDQKSSMNTEVTVVCDCDEGVIGPAMKKVEAAQGKAPRYEKDIRKVVEDKNIDIITIATPNHWHSLAAIWAIQNGKDVYVEKPVSHNVSEGRRVVEAARRFNKICQAGTQSRSMPGMRAAMDHIHTGKLGKVRLAYATCYKPRGSIGKVDGPQMPPKTIDYDLWTGPAPILPLMRKNLHYDWHWIWAYGNGDLGNQGIHEMDKGRWGLNKNELPKSVISVGGRFGYVDDGQTANTQLCLFDYGDSELIFEVRGLKTEDYKGAKIGNIFFGTEGVIVCPNYGGGFLMDNDGKRVKEFKGDGGDGSHFGNFIKAVRSRNVKDLNGDILEGHLSSALCHLGNISYRLGLEKPIGDAANWTDNKDAKEAFGRMIEHLKDNKVDVAKAKGLVGPLLGIDPKTESFPGIEKANAMLTREYRKGFEVPAKI